MRDGLRKDAAARAVAAALFCGYVAGLAAIVFWPTPVDRGAGRLLRAITRRLPFLTYDVIEFLANVALFVPFGALVALLIVRGLRLLVLPIALAVTLTIEATQGLLLDQRTASVSDVIANTLGAAVGLVVAMIIEHAPSRPPATA